MRHLLRFAMAASFLLAVGVTQSAADTITLDNSTLPSDGEFSFSRCGPGTHIDCIDVPPETFIGPVTTPAADDGVFPDGPIAVPGSLAFSLPNTMPSLIEVSPAAEVTAVPEAGSLVLLGSSLVLFARVVRSRMK